MQQQHKPTRSSGAHYPEPIRAYAAMNTVRALECLAFQARSAPELADSLQISDRTTRRLLQRLALEGFVTPEGGYRNRYHVTLRLAALGRQLLDHAPVARAAAPRVARLAQDTHCVAHLWIAGYDDRIVCAVHADARTGAPAVSLLCDVESATDSPAGPVLRRARARLRSCCYLHAATEPAFAAAVLERGRVIAALGVTGDHALEATAAVITTAARLSADLTCRI